MARKQSAVDMFMNFASFEGAFAADASDLAEVQLHTGLSIRGALIWLIHLIEVDIDIAPSSGNNLRANWVLSTVSDQASMPLLSTKGTIAKGAAANYFNVNGVTHWYTPQRQSFLPPVPIAAPALSLYLLGSNTAGLNGVDALVRVGFTTAPLDAAMYTEIAETWGW